MRFDLKNFIRQQGNPKDLLMNFIQQPTNINPMISNLINMAKNGNNKEVEQFAVNLCKEHGIDFYKEFPAFIKSIR